jgi:hypothetical protein
MLRRNFFIGSVLLMFSYPAAAKDVAMTGEELKSLLSTSKTIKLGGPGEGYSGQLVLNPDGTGKGAAKTDDGKKSFKLEGTWSIKKNKFCRKWTEVDGGKEVCETWVKAGDNKVIVKVGKEKRGVNSW